MSDNFQQQDDSMEEILSSIRKILSTDDDVKRTYPKKIENLEGPIELTDVAEVIEDEEEQSSYTPSVVKKDIEKRSFEDYAENARQPWERVTEETVAQADNFKPNTRLVSQATMAASNAALSELTKHVMNNNPEKKESSVNTSVEELLKSMLSPLLKDWLDKNLPTVIEKVVREEIRTIVNNTSK
tara:strand:- start:22106 stop:22660 length:555 start_codon:yes stop_codon:yes gene_type:complete